MGRPAFVNCVDIEGRKHKVPTSDLRWRPSAYGIVIRDGQLLTAKHYKKHNLPGGGIDFGEMPEAAVVREVKEETGIDVKNPRLVSVASQFFKTPYPDKGASFFQTILLYFVCDYAGGEFSMDGFDVYEKIYAEMPEWYPLSEIDSLDYTGSHDWRPIIKDVSHV
ncbi:MAG TPA: NUDIX domain-containing protein [Candidatus Saccharimonadales bacterium]|nr:NUDIX domain-containing protein [Candidatus Saccharimonadales bacterium]